MVKTIKEKKDEEYEIRRALIDSLEIDAKKLEQINGRIAEITNSEEERID